MSSNSLLSSSRRLRTWTGSGFCNFFKPHLTSSTKGEMSALYMSAIELTVPAPIPGLVPHGDKRRGEYRIDSAFSVWEFRHEPYEQRRPWVILRKTDASKTVTTASTWQTQISLSTITDFNRFYLSSNDPFPIRVFGAESQGFESRQSFCQDCFFRNRRSLSLVDSRLKVKIW